MAELSVVEKTKLEKLLGMGSGYVLDFSNRTIQEFIADSVGLNIFDSKYDYSSGSKANRLRALWKSEPNHVVGRVIGDLLEYARQSPSGDFDHLFPDCARVAERLRQGAPVLDDLGTDQEPGERAFQVLVKALRQAIDNNEPETALDRLHTYVVKYMRVVCQKRGIETNRDKPLHSLICFASVESGNRLRSG
jgi:hypothetical protein